jgi:hypothetical protein
MFNDDDGMQLNFIRVNHKGATISLVQHTISDKTTIQEVSILPDMETIVHYDESLDSLIEALQSVKNTMEKNP